MDRRTFVGLATATAAGSLLPPAAFAQTAPKAKNVVLVHGRLPMARAGPK